jgi:hypothetical protein
VTLTIVNRQDAGLSHPYNDNDNDPNDPKGPSTRSKCLPPYPFWDLAQRRTFSPYPLHPLLTVTLVSQLNARDINSSSFTNDTSLSGPLRRIDYILIAAHHETLIVSQRQHVGARTFLRFNEQINLERKDCCPELASIMDTIRCIEVTFSLLTGRSLLVRPTGL